MSFLFRKADPSSVPSTKLGAEMDSQNVQIRTPEEAGKSSTATAPHYLLTLPLPFCRINLSRPALP